MPDGTSASATPLNLRRRLMYDLAETTNAEINLGFESEEVAIEMTDRLRDLRDEFERERIPTFEDPDVDPPETMNDVKMRDEEMETKRLRVAIEEMKAERESALREMHLEYRKQRAGPKDT